MLAMTNAFILLALFASFGCIKKEQKVSEEAQVIKLLNQSEDTLALEKIESLLVKDPENQELLYLKASALSMNAGVDVYKLFPLLKAKIFDVAISEWSQHREFERKMKSRRESPDTTAPEKQEYKPLTDDQIEYKFSNAYSYIWDTSQTDGPQQIMIIFNIHTKHLKGDKINEGIVYLRYLTNELDPLFEVFGKKAGISLNADSPGIELFRKRIVDLIKFEHQVLWENRSKRANKKQLEVKALQALWTVTDMIPLIKQIPKIEIASLNKLNVAQDILAGLYIKNKEQKNEFYQKTRKQLMLISSMKLIARFQDAIDLDQIKNPYDLACLSNDKTSAYMVDSQKDFLLILQGIDDEEFIEKNKKSMKEVTEEIERSMDKLNLDENYRERLIEKAQESLERFKEANCSEVSSNDD